MAAGKMSKWIRAQVDRNLAADIRRMRAEDIAHRQRVMRAASETGVVTRAVRAAVAKKKRRRPSPAR